MTDKKDKPSIPAYDMNSMNAGMFGLAIPMPFPVFCSSSDAHEDDASTLATQQCFCAAVFGGNKCRNGASNGPVNCNRKRAKW